MFGPLCASLAIWHEFYSNLFELQMTIKVMEFREKNTEEFMIPKNAEEGISK